LARQPINGLKYASWELQTRNIHSTKGENHDETQKTSGLFRIDVRYDGVLVRPRAANATTLRPWRDELTAVFYVGA